MKIQILVGPSHNESEIMFDNITIITTGKTFSFANATMMKSMEEVYRFYDDSEVKEIIAIRRKF